MTIVGELRAELGRYGDGPARLATLVRLGQALMAEYNRIGPGRPEARPYLDEAIDSFDKAYAILQPDDAMRGPLAALLGGMLAARYGAHGGASRDCDTGIHVLEEALSFPSMAQAQRVMAQVSLGQLYLARTSAYMQSSGMSFAARSVGVPAPDGALADADRAIACFQAVLDGEPVSADLTAITRTLMDVAEAVRTVLGAVSGNVMSMDIGRLTSALAMMQKLQDQIKSGGAPGYRISDSGLFNVDLEEFIRTRPEERPVAVMHGPAESGPVAPLPRSAPAAPPDVVQLRHSLYALLPGDGADGWPAAADLLVPGTPTPDTTTVDEMVALALTIVEHTPQAQAKTAQAAIDHYVLAVALLLRGGYAEASSDRAAALEELVTAAERIPLVHPAALVILRSLGAFLSETRPLDDALAVVAGRFAGRIDSAVVAGIAEAADLVVLDALRCVCRTAEALTDLRRAAGKVPAEYPWPAPVKAAGLYAEAAAA